METKTLKNVNSTSVGGQNLRSAGGQLITQAPRSKQQIWKTRFAASSCWPTERSMSEIKSAQNAGIRTFKEFAQTSNPREDYTVKYLTQKWNC